MGTRDPLPPLRGRSAELSVLLERVEAAAAGGLTAVLVEGEAGVGKSRLLAEAMAGAKSRGCRVVAGRAEEPERMRPFGVLAEALGCVTGSPDPRRAAVARLLGARLVGGAAVSVTSDPGLRFQVVDALVDLVEAEALRGPVVVAVDDVQWIDPESLLGLDALRRRLSSLPVCVVVLGRPGPRSRELDRFLDRLRDRDARRVDLDGLEEEAVREMVEDLTGTRAGPQVLTSVAAAGGNPLYVTELLAVAPDLLPDGDPATPARSPESVGAGLPARLRTIVRRRLKELPASTSELLRSGAVLGSRFTLEELAAVSGRSTVGLVPDLEEALRHRVLVDDGDRLRFRHDVIRTTVHGDSPPTVRAALHKEAARRLAVQGVPALRVAEVLGDHLDGADEEAVSWLTRAAHETAGTSPGTAAALLDRVVAALPPSAPDRFRAQVAQAEMLVWGGRLPEAEQRCEALLASADQSDAEPVVRTILGRSLLAQGRMQETIDELQKISESGTSTLAQRVESSVYTGIAQLSLGRVGEARAAAEWARSAAHDLGDDALLSIAETALGTAHELQGRYADGLDLVEQAVVHADASPGKQGHRYPHHLDRALLLLELDRFDEARDSCEAGMRLAEALGLPWQLGAYQTVLAVERFTTGAWDEAVAALAAGQEVAEDETGVLGTLVLHLDVQASIALHRDDLATGRQLLDRAAAARRREDSYVRHRGHRWWAAQALRLEAEGAVDAAYDTLVQAWRKCRVDGLVVEYAALAPDVVRLAAVVGDRATASEVTEAMTRASDDLRTSSSTGAALRCLGLRDADGHLLVRAAESYHRARRPLEAAASLEEAGDALERTGDRGQAVECLDRAMETYGRLAAPRDQARARRRLRGLGVRRRPAAPRARARSGWESLTAAELTVTHLAAEGLSNPQIGERLFISRRTVQTHLAHVFQKLQVSSRAELATAVARRRHPPSVTGG